MHREEDHKQSHNSLFTCDVRVLQEKRQLRRAEESQSSRRVCAEEGGDGDSDGLCKALDVVQVLRMATEEHGIAERRQSDVGEMNGY